MNTRLEAVTVLLADDHLLVRLGFRALLESAGARVVSEACTGEEAVRFYLANRPKVALLDLSMPGMGGLCAIEHIRAHDPNARLLVLSAHQNPIVPIRALNAGALGYLGKQAPAAEFLKAVAQVSRGQRYLDPELAPAVALAQFEGTSVPARDLSDKEFMVFLQLAHGHSVQEIADNLNLSGSTVGTHMYHIKQKLGLNNGAQLAMAAVRWGLLE